MWALAERGRGNLLVLDDASPSLAHSPYRGLGSLLSVSL